jgi:hypothetical protein
MYREVRDVFGIGNPRLLQIRTILRKKIIVKEKIITVVSKFQRKP